MVYEPRDLLQDYVKRFRDFVSEFLSKKSGSLFNIFSVKHFSNNIFFTVGRINSNINFEYEKNSLYLFLEMRLRDGQEVEKRKDLKKKLNIKMIKPGRILGDYPESLVDFVLSSMKEFNKEYQESKP